MASRKTHPIRVSEEVHSRVTEIANETDLTQQEVASQLILSQDTSAIEDRVETVNIDKIENIITELQESLAEPDNGQTTKITIHAEQTSQPETQTGQVATLFTQTDAATSIYCPVCGNAIVSYRLNGATTQQGSSTFNQLRISCPHCSINQPHQHPRRDVYTLVTLQSETEQTENSKLWDHIDSADPMKAVWDTIAYEWGIYALKYADNEARIHDFIEMTEPLTADDDIPITRFPDPQLWFDAFNHGTHHPTTKRYQLHRYNLFVKHYLSYLVTNNKLPSVSIQIADWSEYTKPNGELSDNRPFIMFNRGSIPDEVKTLLHDYEQSWTTAKLIADDEHNVVAVVPN